MLKMTVIGNLGKDAIVREVNGRKAINFSIAENQKFKDDDGNQVEKTTWINCTLWRDSNSGTGIMNYLTKGTKVYLEGVPEVKTFKDKNGVVQAELRLNVRSIELLHVNKDGDQQTTSDAAPADDLHSDQL